MSEITKEQLLHNFSNLDTTTLQKLWKYSQLLIIPDEDLLTNVTMVQMVDRANQLADSLFPEWTDRSKTDFGAFLVELISLFSEKNFWYINAFANEGLLKKTRLYSNAFSKASTLGYSVDLCRGAVATFAVVFATGNAITYKRGDLVLSVGSVKFSNDEEFTVQSNETTKNLTLSEGEQRYEDATFNGNSIFVRTPKIDIDSIKVVIDNIVYSRVKNFGLSLADSTHYAVFPEEDGSVSIFFGQDGYGITPIIGKSIQLFYRKCTGVSGNIPVGTASVVDSSFTREAVSATMLGAATHGLDPESITSIKENAPIYFYTKNSAINETVAESMLNKFPFVAKSKVSVTDRSMTYQIIPLSGDAEMTLLERASIVENFEPYILAGYTVENAANNYISIVTAANPLASSIVLDIIVSKGVDTNLVSASARQVMEDLTTPLIKAGYGDAFSKNSLDVLLRNSIKSIQSVSFKLVVGGSEVILPDFTLPTTSIFKKILSGELIVRVNVY